MKKIMIFLLLLLLTGCVGRDPEKRDYALTLFIHGDGTVAVGTAKLTKSGDGTAESVFYDGRGKTLAAAVRDVREKTGGGLYFGHLTLCVLDKKSIDKKVLDEISALFLSNEELAGNVWVLAADDAAALENAAREGEDMVRFAERFYGKNGEYAGNKRAVDANGLMYVLAKTGGNAQIPLARCVNGRPEMAGGIAVKNYICAEDIPREEFLYGK